MKNRDFGFDYVTHSTKDGDTVLPELQASIERARNYVDKDLNSPTIKAEPAPPSNGIAAIIAAEGVVPELIDADIRAARVPEKAADNWKDQLIELGIRFVFQDYLPEDLYKCLRYLGFELLYSTTRACFIIRNPYIKGWHDWQEIRPDKEGIEHLARAKSLMARLCGHLVITNKKAKIKPIAAGAWGKGSELYGNLIALKGDAIPLVNEYERWVNERFEFLDSLTPRQQDSLIADLDGIFENLPGIAPLSEADRTLAKHAGRYVMAMLAHRIIQDHPDFKEKGGGSYARNIRPQREVPIICGEPDVGKSTIWETIMPRIDLFRVAKMKFSANANLMGRACAGNVLMIANEMAQIRAGSVAEDVIKGFIAEPTITFDEKYERNKTISMPSVFVSTANEIKLPSNKALRSRFLIFRLGVDPTLDPANPLSSCSETRGKAIAEYCADHRGDWLNAGLLLARRNTPIQCPKEWGLMRESIARNAGDDNESDLIDTLETMIASGRWMAVGRNGQQGDPAITAAELVWQSGLLKWPRHVNFSHNNRLHTMGETIAPDAGWIITHDDLNSAYNAARLRDNSLADRVKGAFQAVGWINRRKEGTAIQFRKYYPTDAGEIRLVRGYVPGHGGA